jgi:hypothetical protein
MCFAAIQYSTITWLQYVVSVREDGLALFTITIA